MVCQCHLSYLNYNIFLVKPRLKALESKIEAWNVHYGVQNICKTILKETIKLGKENRLQKSELPRTSFFTEFPFLTNDDVRNFEEKLKFYEKLQNELVSKYFPIPHIKILDHTILISISFTENSIFKG